MTKRLADEWDKHLFKTTGYGDLESFRKAFVQLEPHAPEALEMFDRENFELTTMREQVRRDQIAENGFLPSAVTGTSGANSTVINRNKSESRKAGILLEDWSTLDPRIKPKFGVLTFKGRLKDDPTIKRATYGEDIWVLDISRLRDRLTLLPMDSFGWWTWEKTSRWNNHFVPWKYRSLLAPWLIPSLRSGVHEIPEFPKDLLSLFEGEVREGQGMYWETQIFGPITLADVTEFRFTKNPPTPEFRKILKRYGIKIVDMRDSDY